MSIYKPHLKNLRVGFTYGTPDASSSLQLDDTTSGFLPNRVTTTQKNAISSPATGLVVYDSTLNQLCVYNGSVWAGLDTSAPVSIGISEGAVASGTLTANTNATLAIVPGMTVPVIAGATYLYEVYLQGVSGASGGLKASLYGSSTTATFTSGFADSWVYNGSTISGQTQTQTAAGNQIATTAVYSSATITGTIVINAGGNFAVMAAQNVSNGTSTTVLPGSYILLTRIA